MSSYSSIPALFGRPFVAAALASAFLLSLFVNWLISFNIVGQSNLAIQWCLSFLLGGWIGSAVRESDRHALIMTLFFGAASFLGFLLFHWQAPALFWLLLIATVAAILAELGDSHSMNWSLSSLAQLLFLIFLVGTSLLIAAKLLMPTMAAQVQAQLAQVPLIDLRMGISLALFVLVILAGAVNALATFENEFIHFCVSPVLRKHPDGSIVDALLGPFVVAAWLVMCLLCLVTNAVGNLIRTVALFFLNVGEESLQFAVAAFANNEMWRAISKVMLTAALLGISALFISIAPPHLRAAISTSRGIFSLDLNLFISNVLLTLLFLATSLVVSALVALWKSKNPSDTLLPLSRAVAVGAWLFLCIWLAAATSYAANIIFHLHPEVFTSLGVFTALGLVLIGSGIFLGLKIARPIA